MEMQRQEDETRRLRQLLDRERQERNSEYGRLKDTIDDLEYKLEQSRRQRMEDNFNR